MVAQQESEELYLPGSHLAFSRAILVGFVLYVCCAHQHAIIVVHHCLEICILPSLTSSRSLGSVGFPLDEGILSSCNNLFEMWLRECGCYGFNGVEGDRVQKCRTRSRGSSAC